MKSSMKFGVIAVLFLAFSFAANSQRGGDKFHSPEERAEKETNRLVEKLSLNETQAAQVKVINLVYAKKMQKSFKNKKEDRSSVKELKASLVTEKTAEIKDVLTKSQFQSYKEMRVGKCKGNRGKGKCSSKS